MEITETIVVEATCCRTTWYPISSTIFLLTNIKLISISYITLYSIYHIIIYYIGMLFLGCTCLGPMRSGPLVANSHPPSDAKVLHEPHCQWRSQPSLPLGHLRGIGKGQLGDWKKTQISKPVFHTWCEHFISNECQSHRWENISNRSHVVVKHQPRQYIFHRSRNPNFNALHAHQITRQRL